jgi:nucleotide-binding universal stress UspA family protein
MSNVDSQANRPFVMVVGLNISDTDSSGFALDQAARTAMRIPCSTMHLLHVLEARASLDQADEAAGCLRRYVDAKAVELGGLARHSVGIHVRRGEAGREIGQLANDVGADLIIVGTHRRPNIKQLIVGSTAEHVMAIAHCPVFVAGPRPTPHPSHIISIEPPCPDCVATRTATRGQSWWCERHSEPHHLRGHRGYSYQFDLPFETHDSAVTSTGV